MINNKRLIELALQGLAAERERIDSEIAALGQQLTGEPAPQAAESPAAKKASKPQGGLTAAGRKRLSDLMTARWAARRNSNSKGPNTRGRKRKAA